ncbi:Compactin diketide synthase [Apiospora saccharicola]|uniref:Compactin diketide synthase n=1 Tax=Apiospora saccharicola TaxID=335842 RepID=A0ABR1VAN7_9PEZI
MENRQPLAIVGYAYRAPGTGRKGLWEFLSEAQSAWSPIPPDRFNAAQFYHPDPAKGGFIHSHGGHFLPDDICAFDAGFFHVTAEEARAMDPQHRLLLETAFEAVEHAGLRLPDLAGADFGVFCANDYSDYSAMMVDDLFTTNKYTALGVCPSLAANRISYFFGLTGPSLVVDAACAGSHYALHLACQSIWSGECAAALVGGAKILNSPSMWSAIDTMGALSPEGRSFAYDVKASGYGKGEGGGCVVIKPLRDALADGDPVRAVLRNAVCSHSGRTPGITMPSQAAQMKLLRRVHMGIGLDPTDTTFAEGHGTGTPVGDPIDASALAAELGSKSSAENPLHIGSIKSNVGHLEGASGIISIIKSIMMLERGVMLPNAGFEKMNPKIEGGERLKVRGPNIESFGGSNGAVLLEEAPSGTKPNGITSTNGATEKHEIAIRTNGYSQDDDLMSANISISLTLNDSPSEDLPDDDDSDGDGPDHHLFVFSAKSLKSLKMTLLSFFDYIEQTPHTAHLAQNICYTLGSRRTNFPQRIAVTADSLVSLRGQLLSMLGNADNIQVEKKQENPAVGYIFTGQGAQYFQMATRLRRYAVFRQAILDAEATLRRLGAPWSLSAELAAPERLSRVDSVEIAQPACTAVQIALTLLLRSWGLTPATVVGHSSGEIAAAFAAGFLSQDTALAVAYMRGVAAQKLLLQQDASGARGAMLALGIGGDAAAELLEGEANRVVVAAFNSPGSVTVSGDLDAIVRVHTKAQQQGLFARRLKVGVAYHSSHMQQVADFYMESIRPFFLDDGLPSAKSTIEGPLFISSVTGRVEGPAMVGPSYWVRNLVQPVNFLQAIETLSALGSEQYTGSNESRIQRPNVFIEIGPHPALKTSVFQCFEDLRTTPHQEAGITYLPSLSRGQDSSKTILDLAGKLFAMGIPVDLAEANRTNDMESRAVVTLPPYEWDKAVRYTHQSRVTQEKLHGGGPYDPLIGWRSERVDGGQNFRNIISLDDMPWVRGYTGHGKPSIPSTVFLSMGIGAFKSLHPGTTSLTLMVRDVSFLQTLALGADNAVDITIRMRPLDGNDDVSGVTPLPRPWIFEVASWSEVAGWAVHCRGVVDSCRDGENLLLASPRVQEALEALKDGTLEDRSPANEYAILKRHSIAYGDFSTAFMVDLKQGPGKVVHTIAVRASDRTFSNADPQHERGPGTLATNPQTLDSFFHSLGIVQELTRRRLASTPFALRNWTISDISLKADQHLVIVTKRLAQNRKLETLTVSLVVFDVSNENSPKPVAELDSLDLKTIPDPDNAHHTPCLPVTFWNKKVPSIDFVERGFLSDLIAGQLPPVDEREVRRLHELNSLSMYFIRRMWEELETSGADLSGLPHHLSKFLTWSKRQIGQSPLPLLRDVGDMLADFSQGNGRDQLTCRVGEQLVDIVLGRKQTLDIMSQDNLLSRYYLENTTSIRGNEAVAHYVQCLIECNPDLRILEVGGGTAGTALPVLSAIEDVTRGATARFHYTFTDISPSFFGNAREKLKTWREEGRITFRKLDITQDPAAQGFDMYDYDLVIAANVLHATPNLDVTLRHVRSLVKPGGKLALVEIVKEITPFSFPFAMLPQWWVAEDRYRAVDAEMTPLVSEQTWDDALVSNGFSGVEGRVDDYPEERDRLYTAMWSTATTDKPAEDIITTRTNSHRTLAICVVSSNGAASEAFSEDLSAKLEAPLGARPQCQNLAEMAASENKPLCIIIDASPQESILSNLSEADFGSLNEIWTKSTGLLWILPEGVHPDAEMIRGFLNAARQEDSSKSLLLLDNVPLDSEGVAVTARVVAQRLFNTDPSLRREQEFSLVGGVIHVPRLYRAHSAEEIFALEEEDDDDEDGNKKKLSPIYRAPGALLRPDATYVITGGTGGIGRSLAAWMVTQGARYIVLLGRSSASSPKVAALLKTFEGTGVCMRTIACNVGARADVDRAVEILRDWSFPQVRGVVHGALSLRDAMLVNATYDDWVGITRPKIQGAWNMHHAFPDLDFFVALASLDGVLGNVGQTIYSGTSTFLEAFVEYRLSLGQPAASITLPVITETGVAAASKLSETIHNQLALTFDVPQVHTMVKAAIVGGSLPSASGLFGRNGRSFSFFQDAVSAETEPLDWERYWSCAAVRRPVIGETAGGGEQASSSVKTGPRDANSGEKDSPASAMERLGDKISAVTMIERHEITPERGLAEYGLDSLVAVDLRNWIRRSFGVDLPLNAIVEASNLRSLTEEVVSRVKAQ